MVTTQGWLGLIKIYWKPFFFLFVAFTHGLDNEMLKAVCAVPCPMLKLVKSPR